MCSHPVALDVWFLVWPVVYYPSSCVRTVKALARLRGCAASPEPSLVAYVTSTKISWAGSCFLIDPSGFNQQRKGTEPESQKINFYIENYMHFVAPFWQLVSAMMSITLRSTGMQASWRQKVLHCKIPTSILKFSKRVNIRDSSLRGEYFLLGKKVFGVTVAQFHLQQFPGEEFKKKIVLNTMNRTVVSSVRTCINTER